MVNLRTPPKSKYPGSSKPKVRNKLRGYQSMKSLKGTDESGTKRSFKPVKEEPQEAVDEEIFYDDDEHEDEDYDDQVDAVVQLGSGNTPLHVDLDKLLKTRLLVVANSGGGKSFLLRQLAEKAARFTTIIVLDIEGEYASLREASTLRDILLIGDPDEKADVAVDLSVAGPMGAALVSEKQHAIIDLSVLRPADKQKYLADFLAAALELPKENRESAMIIIDEVHVMAPARGTPPSKRALSDLMARGRKRGLCGVIATQRIAKADANVLAEANAVLVGRTRHDNDQERAAEILGLTKGGGKTLSNLKPGEFWAVGAAFTEAFDDEGDEDSYKFQAGKPRSTHPEVGLNGKKKIRRTRPSAETAERIPLFASLEPDEAADLEDLSPKELREMVADLQYQLQGQHFECPACGHDLTEDTGIPRYGKDDELPSSGDDEDLSYLEFDEDDDDDEPLDFEDEDEDEVQAVALDGGDDDILFMAKPEKVKRNRIKICRSCGQLDIQCTCNLNFDDEEEEEEEEGERAKLNAVFREVEEAENGHDHTDGELSELYRTIEEDDEDEDEEDEEDPCEDCGAPTIETCVCLCECGETYINCVCPDE